MAPYDTRCGRRPLLLGGAAALGALATLARARADEALPPLTMAPLSVASDPVFGREVMVLRPRHLGTGERRPVLVLLHGLGEATDVATGIRAWVARYGLVRAHERLRNPPVRAESARGDWPTTRLREVNDELTREPFRGFVLVCPFTPAAGRAKDPQGLLDRYARWLEGAVLPRVLEAVPEAQPGRVGLDGCSLGGWLALEVFRRVPSAIGSLGCIQAAISEGSAEARARVVLAACERDAPALPVHVLTSRGDPFRGANERFAAALARGGARVQSRTLPGPHDQPWLREAGTAEALLFHDRAWLGAHP